MSVWPAWVESKAIRAPSEDQRGAPTPAPPKLVNCTGTEPSLLQIQISELPDRLDTKAIFLPSGEYRGLVSSCVEEINLVGGLPRPVELDTSVRQRFESINSCA